MRRFLPLLALLTALGVFALPFGWADAAGGPFALDPMAPYRLDANIPGYRLEAIWPQATHGLTLPVSLAADNKNRIWVLDGSQQKTEEVVALNPDGSVAERRPAPRGALDLSVEPGGDIFYGRYMAKPDMVLGKKGDINSVLRVKPDGTVSWSQKCECGTGAGVAAAEGRVWYADPANKSMVWYGAVDGRTQGKVSLAAPASGFPADLDVAPDGTLFATDQMGDAVYAWPPPYLPKDFSVWRVDNESSGPFRVDVGADSDGLLLVTVLHSDGLIRVHRADGTLVARFYVPGEPLDVAMGVGGRIYVLDEAAALIRVYVPGPPPTPTPVPADPPIARSSCLITGTKTVSPAALDRCGKALVTLKLDAACPPDAVSGADIALVIDRSLSMLNDTPSRMSAAKAAAKKFLVGLDFRYHRVTIVTFGSSSRIDQPLTADRKLLDTALDNLWPDESGTNIYGGVRAASDHLAAAGRPNALPVIVMLTDGDPSDPKVPEPATAALAAAERARTRRTYFVTVGLGNYINSLLLEVMASSKQDFYYSPSVIDLDRIYQTILKVVQSLGITDVSLEERPNAPFARYVAGSGSPPPLIQNELLTWNRPVLPANGLTFTYTLQSHLPGRETVSRTQVRYLDADGTRRTLIFPDALLAAALPTSTPGGTGGPTQPAPTPTLAPYQPVPGCAPKDGWTVLVSVFPDTVGYGGYRCQGCNDRWDQGDHWANGIGGSSASQVTLSDTNGRLLWAGPVAAAKNGPASASIRLCSPPPYVVRLYTPPPGYVTCPNTPASRLLTANQFSAGHNAQARFALWAGCGLPTPTPMPQPTALPACPE